MGRAPCCDKANVKKGPWSPEEDSKLKDYINKYGTGGNWIALPQKAGLKRCGKSCRLRWLNYLRPNLKHGEFTETEDRIICTLFANIGSRWSIIAAQLPGRTDNDIKNYWNTKLKKKLMGMVHPQAQAQAQRKPHPQPQHIYSSSQLQNLPISLPSLHYNTTHDLVQFQEQESLVNPMHYFSAPAHVTENNINNNLLMLGSDQTSCSSSDGSCSQMSNNNIKQEDNHQMGFLQSFISNNGFQESHSFKYSSSSLGFNNSNQQWTDTSTDQKGNGYFGEISFDNEIEDFKQLISSSNYYDNMFSSNS